MRWPVWVNILAANNPQRNNRFIMPSLSPILSVMTRAAEKAAKSLLRDFGEVEQLQVSIKGPGDFVSAADRRAEQILHQELFKARPDYSFLMEESGTVGPKEAECRFIIDPLDGTHNFLHGIPHWAISIALEKAGEMVAGVIYDPVKNEMFYAEKGSGAYMNDRRIRVSGRKEPERSIVGYWYNTPGRYDFDRYLTDFKKLAGRFERHRQIGATAIDLAWVACGRYDAFVQHDTKLWDVAAGIAIIREAGGKTINMHTPESTTFDNSIIASNAHLMPVIQELLGV